MAARAVVLLFVAAARGDTRTHPPDIHSGLRGGGGGGGVGARAAEPSCTGATADCTDPLQAALNGTAAAVTFPAGTAITRPLFLRGDDRVVRFRAGAVLLAMRWQYVGVTDRMLTVSGASNVSLLGAPGATLRMWGPKDYFNRSVYAKSGFRAAIEVEASSQVLIAGLTIECTGGDCIEFHVCQKVTVRDVICDRAFRNGLSSVGTVGMLVMNSTFGRTFGTSPGAGTDIEPAGGPRDGKANYEDEIGIVFRDCRFPENFGAGISLALAHLSNTSDEISVTFENCSVVGESPHGPAPPLEAQAAGSSARGSARLRGASPHAVLIFAPPTLRKTAPQSIVFRDLLVANRSGAALYIPAKADASASVLFERARFENTATAAPSVIALGDPFIKAGSDEDGGDVGGITLRETTIVDPRPACRPFLSYLPVCTDTACAPLLDLHGDVKVIGNPAACCATSSGPSIPKNVTQTNVSLSVSCAAKTDDLERAPGNAITPSCAATLTNCRDEVMRALDAAGAAGGGTVVLTPRPNSLPWVIADADAGGQGVGLSVGSNHSHVRLVLQRGVVVQAQRGAYKPPASCKIVILSRFVAVRLANPKSITISDLLLIQKVSNFTLSAYGARFKMWREDYNDSKHYKPSGDRHGIMIAGASNVLVEGVTVDGSGGDGIIIGVRKCAEDGSEPACMRRERMGLYPQSRNITVRDSTFTANRRQGMTVESAENLLVSNCLFNSTGSEGLGTDPMA